MGTNNPNEDDHVALSENKGMNREDMKDREERKASIAERQENQKKEMFTFMWVLHF